MSLPTPNLDDRKFQDIVDETKRQIALRCPEWTDHNVSDPGVTLIELFASSIEMMLFRLNQVPEKNYIKFLELLGITLETPKPASTHLRFFLSRYLEERESVPDIFLPSRDTLAATPRTEREEAIEFGLDRDLRMAAPVVASIFAMPAGLDHADAAREMNRTFEAPTDKDWFEVFSKRPEPGDAVCFGFGNDLSANIIQIEVESQEAAATRLNQDCPLQVWEYYEPVTSNWLRLELLRDTTNGFAKNGMVELALPDDMAITTFAEKKGRWIRCRYAKEDEMPEDLRNRLGTSLQAYDRSPEIRHVRLRTIGGTVPASNCVTVRNEILGVSEQKPGQVFKLQNAPVLEFAPDEVVLVGMVNEDGEVDEWARWTRVVDFSESGPNDKHFVCDTLTGEISFGPNISQPEGGARQYGAIPPKGHSVSISAYRFGGGLQGNVREGAVTILKSTYPLISEVTNIRPAQGGSDRETLERAKIRALEVLKVRNRAVTAEDYEYLAKKAAPEVGRAKCLTPNLVDNARSELNPGEAKVVIIPALSDTVLAPRPLDLAIPPNILEKVKNYLDERRLLTTVLMVDAPKYVYVSTEVKIVAAPQSNPEAVARLVEEKLYRYLHPLFGGPAGTGWPFDRNLTLSDIYAVVGSVRGVAFLLDARIYASTVTNEVEGLLGRPQLVSNKRGLELEEGHMICSRQHNVKVRPIWEVGEEPPQEEG